MRIAKLLLGLALALAAHLVGLRIYPALGRFADVFLVALVLHALEGNSLSAILAGVLVGLLEDSLSNGPYGLYGFADTAVAFITARLAQRLVIQRASGVFSIVSFAAIMQRAILVLLAILVLPNPAFPEPLDMAVEVTIKATTCGLLGMLLYVAGRRLRRNMEVRRTGRMGRLRLE